MKGKKSLVGWIESLDTVYYASTNDDYKYRLYGIFKHKQEWAQTKVRITIEELKD